MLVLNTQLEGSPVMSLQTGGSLGALDSPIIDPRKLKIVAYYVSGPRIPEVSVLHTADIREIGPLGIIVDGNEAIMTLDEDLVRLREVIDFSFNLVGKSVIDQDKKKLGKVLEYSLETEDFSVQKIHVGQSMIKSVRGSNMMIHRSQIVELNDRYIVVKSGKVQKPFGISQMFNPLRKSPAPLAPEAIEKSTQ